MKNIGLVLLALGTLAFFIGFNYDTSVATEFGRVNNIGLMNDRQNIIIFASVLAIIGAVFFGFTWQSTQQPLGDSEHSGQNIGTRKCPYCAEIVKTEAIICRFCQKELPPIAESTEKIDPPESSKSKYWAFGIFSILLTLYFILRITPPVGDIDRVIRQEGEAREDSEISDNQHSKIEDDQEAARARRKLDKYNQEYEEQYAKEAAAMAASPSVQAELPEIAPVEDEVALPPLTEESVK